MLRIIKKVPCVFVFVLVSLPAFAMPPTVASTYNDQAGMEAMLSHLTQQQNALLAERDPIARLEIGVPKRPLKKGSSGSDVKLLCDVLAARGFGLCPIGTTVIDDSVVTLLRNAQRFYGLQDDGFADAQIYNALRLSTIQRAAKVGELVQSLMTIREQARALGATRYVIVNIPSFEIKAIENDHIALTSKAIVGMPDRQTPQGIMNISALKFNPNWSPPPTILKKSVYPSLATDGKYIKSHGLILQDETGEKIDWVGLTVEDVKANGYRFVQPSGDNAALGKLKFETDNAQNIYLHDTNERRLFSIAMRAKSSGCIRVQNWRELAAWIASSSVDKIDAQVDSGKMFWVKTPKTPVFLMYQTVDYQNGKTVFYPDIYKRA